MALQVVALQYILGSRAAGGAGLIIQATYFLRRTHLSRRSGLWKEHIEKLAQINQFIGQVKFSSWKFN
jgi:2,4-dienoyl-CoA reductase-like NADH-dependent reductase (Old Yellow Enzyme family)